LFVGAVGGLICVASTFLLEHLQIDDAVGAVPVHLLAGIWGTLAVALCAPDGSWGPGVTRMHQLGIQLLGISVIGAYAFGVSWVVLSVVNRFLSLRVSEEDERIGLNIAEHGASSALLELIVQMDSQARQGDFTRRVDVEPETEAARIAAFYNAVLDKFSLETDRRQMAMKKLSQLANYDTLTGAGNRRLFLEALSRAWRRAHGGGSGGALLYIDIDDFKIINDRYGHDVGDALLKRAAACMSSLIEPTDVIARLGGDEFTILCEGADHDRAGRLAERLLALLSAPFSIGGRDFKVHASIGVALYDGSEADSGVVNRRADEAMYTAKLAGKGAWRMYAIDGEDFAPSV